MRPRHLSSSLLALAALQGVPASARAACEATSADISWVRGAGAETCPGAASIRSEVARRLGRPVGEPGEGKSVEVTVEKTESGWSARIVARGCDGETAARELTSAAPTCEAIASAAALVIAIAIDPRAALAPHGAAESDPAGAPAPVEAPASSPEPPSEAPPAPSTAPSAERSTLPRDSLSLPPAPAPAARSVVRTHLTLRAVAAEGLLPTFAPGAAWAGEWRFSRWISVSTGVLFLPEQPAADPTFAFGMTAGWAGACSDVLALADRLFAGPCVRVLAGAIHAVVHTHPTIIGSGPGQRAWAGGAAGGRILARITGPLVAEAGVEALAPFTRYSFVLREAPDPVFLQSPVVLVLHIGAGLTFP